jgi:hypothetical protein
MEFGDLSEFVDIPTDRAEEDKPAPVLPPRLIPVYIAHGELGTDESGRPTVEERQRLLDEMGVTDPAERECWWFLWGEITQAQVVETKRYADSIDRSPSGA